MYPSKSIYMSVHRHTKPNRLGWVRAPLPVRVGGGETEGDKEHQQEPQQPGHRHHGPCQQGELETKLLYTGWSHSQTTVVCGLGMRLATLLTGFMVGHQTTIWLKLCDAPTSTVAFLSCSEVVKINLYDSLHIGAAHSLPELKTHLPAAKLSRREQ